MTYSKEALDRKKQTDPQLTHDQKMEVIRRARQVLDKKYGHKTS